MKKFKNALAVLLMLTTMTSFAGCSITTEQSAVSETTVQETFLIGSPGKTEDFEFGVTGINSFDVVTDYGETMHYLLVSVNYTNLTDKEQDISKRNIEFYLDNEEIFSCEYRSEFEDFFEEGLLFNDKKVHPGRTKRGYIVYRIYRDYSTINVCMNDITVTAYSDEVTPLVSQAEIDINEQPTESETTPETTAATPAPVIAETVVTTEATAETAASSEATDSVPTE